MTAHDNFMTRVWSAGGFMRQVAIVLLACTVTLLPAQQNPEGPTNEKAQKSYKEALDYLRRGMVDAALDGFKKADKQDGGHCLTCQRNMIKYGIEIQEWKVAETAAEEMLADAQGEKSTALAHYELGRVLLRE